LGATQAVNYTGAPIGVNFGTITSTASPAIGFPPLTLSGINVTLTITQTAPASGTGAFTGQVSGTLSYNSGSGTLTFSPFTTVITAGGSIVDYEIDTLNIVVPSTGGGITTINGFIDSVSLTSTTPPPTTTTPPPTSTPPPGGAPEPGTMGLLGGSLLGLGFFLRRRFRK